MPKPAAGVAIARMSPVPRTTRRSLGIVALALLFLVAQLGDTLHQVRSPHERCAEHGEWIHAPGHTVAEASATADADERGPVLVKGPESHAGDPHHEHCNKLSPHRERWLAPLGRPTVIVPVAARSHAVAPARTPAPKSIPTYRLAPKQSPPCC